VVLGQQRVRRARLAGVLDTYPEDGIKGMDDWGQKIQRSLRDSQTLEQLHASVRERLDRVERSRSSPNNLIKHNPAFVGRVRELTELRSALATCTREC
jgi:hypothetical protein